MFMTESTYTATGHEYKLVFSGHHLSYTWFIRSWAVKCLETFWAWEHYFTCIISI